MLFNEEISQICSKTPEQQKHTQIEVIQGFLQVAQQAYQMTNDPRLEIVILKYERILSLIEKPKYMPF